MESPTCVGGLVTSHKASLFRYGRSCFAEVSRIAEALEEISTIYKRKNCSGLFGEALDTVSIVPVAEEVTVRNVHWMAGSKEVVILGGGGAGIALVYALCNIPTRPRQISVVERNEERVNFLRKVVADATLFTVEGIKIIRWADADNVLREAGERPLIVNATGMGKDVPGSPVKDVHNIPFGSTLWDFNYRGELDFLKNAQQLASQERLLLVDGWDYFISGWMHAMCRIFHVRCSPDIAEAFEEVAYDFMRKDRKEL